ncbi:MAG: queuosine precursor transporter [Candidatus Gracilibacteria bacterium]|nr:queuosine precursor transporter [Candidatus Gracilibacteria bacterium]
MSNNIIFIIYSIVALGGSLFSFKMGRIWLCAYIAACVVLMNIFVLKQMTLFGMAVTGGNVLYSSIFLSSDLLTEHYGKKVALQAVRIGFFISVFFVIASQFILLFHPNEFDFIQDSFLEIFSLTPRIVAASMLSYLLSQHLDVYLFEKIKDLSKGRYLWLRNNLSTFLSQAVDSVFFTLAAFYGVFANNVIWQIILFTYLVKLIVALLDTPFIYLSKLEIMKPLDKN